MGLCGLCSSLWVSTGLCSLHGRSPWVSMGLHGSLQSPQVSVGLHGLCGRSLQVSVGGLSGSPQALRVSTGLCRSPQSVGLHRRSPDLIEIIQFCLKIYNLQRHFHPSVGGSVVW